jgi:uncharacterized protein (DUF983 family)
METRDGHGHADLRSGGFVDSELSSEQTVEPPMAQVLEHRDAGKAMWRGLLGRCPNCGEGHLFRRYLKVANRCENCGEELHHHRADDAPPYFTMVIVGHVVIAGVLAVEVAWHPQIWVHLIVWLPLTLALSLALLPRIKGAIVGMQWANRMHGFNPDQESDTFHP